MHNYLKSERRAIISNARRQGQFLAAVWVARSESTIKRQAMIGSSKPKSFQEFEREQFEERGIYIVHVSVQEIVVDSEIAGLGRRIAHDFVNVFDIVSYGVSKANGNIAHRSKLVLKLANGSNSVQGTGVLMVFVKTRIVIVVEIRDDAAGDGDAHSNNVDEDVQLVLEEIPECDEQIILDHNEGLLTVTPVPNDSRSERIGSGIQTQSSGCRSINLGCCRRFSSKEQAKLAVDRE